MSTEDIGLKSVILRLEMDMRLLDIDEREERAEATDDGEGEADRGVEMSDELDELKGYDAIDITGACVGGSDAEKKEEAEVGDGTRQLVVVGRVRRSSRREG